VTSVTAARARLRICQERVFVTGIGLKIAKKRELRAFPGLGIETWGTHFPALSYRFETSVAGHLSSSELNENLVEVHALPPFAKYAQDGARRFARLPARLSRPGAGDARPCGGIPLGG
jgi:hypothetical protein